MWKDERHTFQSSDSVACDTRTHLLTMRFQCAIALVVLSLGTGGCATVPREAVVLSETVGEDVRAVHTSYAALVRTHFASLRRQVNTFIDTRWTPTYLREFIQEGDLVALAKDPDPVAVLDGVGTWAGVAVEEIESKRRELLDPIDQDERELLVSVDDAFARITQANAALTAHLRSIRKVKDIEDQALEAAHLKELRDQVTARLSDASERADRAIKDLERASGEVKDVKEKKEELMKRRKGGGRHR